MKLCGATAAAPGIACRSKIFRSGNAGTDDGANAFEKEHQSDRHTDCRRADPRIHHADKTRAHQQNADRQDPAPAANTEGVQIECADEPGNAGKHQPDRKDKRQRQKCEPLVKEQEQRHDYGQHAVEQQPAGADQHTACSGKDHNLRDARSQHENAEHQTRGQNRNIFIAQTINACRNQQDASYDIQDPNCLPVKRRIMDMGITKGVEIYVRKVAPLGDPVEVTVRGYELSLRKADAEMICVE